MSTKLESKKKKAVHISLKKKKKLLTALKSKLGKAKLKNTIQWVDFNVNGNVIHAQIQYLEWLYGSVYRKHIYHYFLVYNFGVNKSDLNNDHQKSLKSFVKKVKLDELLRTAEVIPREFEEFEDPFAANIKDSLKEKLIKEQPWVAKTSASREDIVRGMMLDTVLDKTSSKPWWKNDSICFPDIKSSITIDDKNSSGNDIHYKAFKMKHLMFWRTAPGVSGVFSTFTGRASETGTDNINDPLSIKRAKSVTDFLGNEIKKYTGLNGVLLTHGVGSRNPILFSSSDLKIKNKEINENRSVQFTYYQAHDYVCLKTENELKKQYAAAIKGVNTLLEKNIAYCEAHVSSPKPSFQIPHKFNVIESGIISSDLKYTLGVKAIEFVQTFNGDFSDLSKTSSPINIPKGIRALPLNYSPENSNTPGSIVLPLSLILVHGKKGDKTYKKPLVIEDRNSYATKVFGDLRKFIFADFKSKGETFTPNRDRARLFMKIYKETIKHDQQKVSFILKKYNIKDRNTILDDNSYRLKVDFSKEKDLYTKKSTLKSYLKNDSIALNIIDYDGKIIANFKNFLDSEIQKGSIKEFYWYDDTILKVHRKQKRTFALNVLKMHALTKLPEVPTAVFGGLDIGVFDISPYDVTAMTFLSHMWMIP
ncbi:hypothetical protein [Aquimarina sp. AU474]|uniref:hypothetical protein n=1 Tax=Aquimarina sp. AU474 TaxID=2108529 RepID=UPI000D69D961|nr:hypothetical protein [Aquimarina sp. AU474]